MSEIRRSPNTQFESSLWPAPIQAVGLFAGRVVRTLKKEIESLGLGKILLFGALLGIAVLAAGLLGRLRGRFGGLAALAALVMVLFSGSLGAITGATLKVGLGMCGLSPRSICRKMLDDLDRNIAEIFTNARNQEALEKTAPHWEEMQEF